MNENGEKPALPASVSDNTHKTGEVCHCTEQLLQAHLVITRLHNNFVGSSCTVGMFQGRI